MSFGGQYDDSEVERQLQEEFRRRQALGLPQPTVATQLRTDYGHVGLMDSPYYAQQRQAYPYASPYHPHPHHQHGRSPETQQQQQQQLQQQQLRLIEEQKHYHQAQQQAAQAVQANYAAAYGSPHDRAYNYNYARDTQDPYLQPFLAPAPVDKSSPQALEAATSPVVPSSAKVTAAPNRKPRTTPPKKKVTMKALKSSKLDRVIDGNTIKDGDGNVTWYTGNVPLGLDDDKYWLSELQVYLRSNFAEAFGATEEDIAAPMHGRNKPIALGQVGIRCMHCKGKYRFSNGLSFILNTF